MLKVEGMLNDGILPNSLYRCFMAVLTLNQNFAQIFIYMFIYETINISNVITDILNEMFNF